MHHVESRPHRRKLFLISITLSNSIGAKLYRKVGLSRPLGYVMIDVLALTARRPASLIGPVLCFSGKALFLQSYISGGCVCVGVCMG